MFITARVFQEEGSWIAEIPFLDGATFCDVSEDIRIYVMDYLASMGVEAAVDFEGKDTLVIRPTEETALVAAALKRMRGSRSLAEVSQGIARTTLHQYEQGKRDPSLATLGKLLGTLGFDFELRISPRKSA